MKRLYFIRHGLSEMNVSALFAGITNTPLTDEGRRQATKAGKQAKKLKIDLIISSPLSRALDTAKLIAAEIGYPEKQIILNDILMERNYGQMEGQPYSPTLSSEEMLDAETPEDMLIRARQALDFIESQTADNILVVSHGSFGRALRHHTTEDFPFSHPHRIPNAEMMQLV